MTSTTDAPATNFGQQLKTLIESDLLTSFGGPLLTFLTGVQAANGDNVKIAAAFIQLQGNAVAAAPSALGELEGQLAAALAAKLAAMTVSVTATKPAA